MPIVRYDIAPGVVKDETELAGKGQWVDMQWVRADRGRMEKIRGYQSGWLTPLYVSTNSYVVATSGTIPGIVRGLHAWSDLSNLRHAAAGSNQKLVIADDAGLWDITPFTSTATVTSNGVVTSSGSPTVTVNFGTATHTATTSDWVYITGATAVAGVTLAGPYQSTYLTGTSLSVTASSTATSAGTGGGTALVVSFELAVGLQDGLYGPGYGVGTYGSSTYSNTSVSVFSPRTWSLAHFGQYLIACPRGGAIYEWQLVKTTRAAKLTNAPTQNNVVVVSAERFIIACGSHDGSTFDAMLINWSDINSDTTWTPAITNQAGNYRLAEGSLVMAAASAPREVLIWTDTALYAMRYLRDPTLVYGFTLLGTNCGAISPNAMVIIGGMAIWMGNNGQFYIYDGSSPRAIPNPPIRDYVFTSLEPAQQEKIWAGLNSAKNEVWFLYPGSSAECDSYVIFNYTDNAWSSGTVARSAWLDAGVLQYPLAAGTDGKLYIHETVWSADGANLHAHLECAPIDIADGNVTADVFGFIPDIKDLSNNLLLTAYTREWPHTTKNSVSAGGAITSSSGRCDIRGAGRQFGFRLDHDDSQGGFRLGVIRLDVQEQGQRA